MTSPPGPELQRAIAFLSSNAVTGDGQPPLPATPDYDALARRACAAGYDLTPAAVEEAFRLVMRARLAVLGKVFRTDGRGG